jgi:hypothetical protein
MMTLKRIRDLVLIAACLFSLTTILQSRSASAATAGFIGTKCDPTPGEGGDLLGIPTWYQYLDGKWDGNEDDPRCVPQLNTDGQGGIDLASAWLIGLAIIEIMLRLAGLVAIGYVIFGGFKYITSQGSPDATKSARQTIINAFIGIVITIIAGVSVNFVAKLLQ